MVTLDDIRVALERPSGTSSDFDLNPDVTLPEGRKLRDAAVLIPLIQKENGLSVVLTKRASHLKHHPGQVAFPGGKVEDFDQDITAAALREADEEICLPVKYVEPMGFLDLHETVTSFRVHPLIAHVTKDFEPRVDPNEVAEVFDVPLDFLINPDNFQIEYRMWQGVRRRYFTIPHGPFYIWRATARMLRGFADRMK